MMISIEKMIVAGLFIAAFLGAYIGWSNGDEQSNILDKIFGSISGALFMALATFVCETFIFTVGYGAYLGIRFLLS